MSRGVNAPSLGVNAPSLGVMLLLERFERCEEGALLKAERGEEIHSTPCVGETICGGGKSE